jgi:hypothetical protein
VLRLTVLEESLAIARLDPGAAVPSWATRSAFHSVTRTPAELSIVCAEREVPADAQAERGWRALQVAGPIPFASTGVLASLAGPLARAELSLFALATYDTDYVLVRSADLERACSALEQAGHDVQRPAAAGLGSPRRTI